MLDDSTLWRKKERMEREKKDPNDLISFEQLKEGSLIYTLFNYLC